MTPVTPRVVGCGALTVSDYHQPLTVDTRWAVVQPSGIVTGLLSPRGILRWSHGETACLSCGHPVSAHVNR